jgi:hypothetical protein
MSEDNMEYEGKRIDVVELIKLYHERPGVRPVRRCYTRRENGDRGEIVGACGISRMIMQCSDEDVKAGLRASEILGIPQEYLLGFRNGWDALDRLPGGHGCKFQTQYDAGYEDGKLGWEAVSDLA